MSNTHGHLPKAEHAQLPAELQQRLAAWTTKAVAYLLAADNVSGPLPYRLGPRNQPVIHPPNQFSIPVSAPVSLPLRAPQPLPPTLLNRHPVLAYLWLGPRRHPIEQHLFQRPHVVRQARRHRRGARPPHLR